MKKLTIVAILITVTTILAGCTNDQYAIERQYYRLMKRAGKIADNPHASPPRELEIVVSQLKKFINKNPQNNLSIEAEFNIARLYIVKEEYDKARAELKTIIDAHSKSEQICAEAVFLTGNSYQRQDNWDAALQQFKKIMQNYPTTLRGLDIPLYIANNYKAKYQPDKMISAFQEAILHYKALAEKHPDSPLAYSADYLAVQCYVELKEWQSAVDNINSIIEKYKGKINLDGLLMEMALIYRKELKDGVKAKETLQRLISDYPKSRLIKAATGLLKEIEQK